MFVTYLIYLLHDLQLYYLYYFYFVYIYLFKGDLESAIIYTAVFILLIEDEKHFPCIIHLVNYWAKRIKKIETFN